MMRAFQLICLIVSTLVVSCNNDNKLFNIVDPEYSGIGFSNMLSESDSFNVLTFEYIYDGAGVGVGDFNNDGLEDVFFAGNMTSCELYLNKGDLKFENVTQLAGLTTNVWCSGVSIVDINGDGWLDVYVSTLHPDINKHQESLFFISKGADNNGVPIFEESAKQLGLNDNSYSTQTVFFDFDLDGDLDAFVLTNSLEDYARMTPRGQKYDGTGKSVDRLYRQDVLENGQIFFKDVSKDAGILGEGWGLGIVVNDFNNDDWPDIYCANDFLSSDHLYINQKDGTFIDEIGAFMNHQELNGMGMDIADLNNDGFNEIFTLDMMPEDNPRRKSMFSGMGYDRFMQSLNMQYQPQFMRNVLQRNNGNGTFSDISYYSDMYATDWSWSVLLADFDNDGLRDVFITNGYPKDVTDKDFMNRSRNGMMFGSEEHKMEVAEKEMEGLGGVHKPDFLFKNKGEFRFEDVSEKWGFSEPTYSNGAAYADFDNDGDLDLIVNSLNGVAHLYENTTNPNENDNLNYLRIRLFGPKGNRQGIGSKVILYADGQIQYAEQQLQRGYASSVETTLHFGLGKVKEVDSIKVIWPGDQMQILKNISVNSLLMLKYSEAIEVYTQIERQEPLTRMTDVPKVVMEEREYADYRYGQSTIPHKFSQQGPFLTVGDINGDSLEDIIVGGSAYNSAKILIQELNGQFSIDSLDQNESEDIGIHLFDADNDNDLDLYCVSGGSEFGRNRIRYKDRLYINDGQGKFEMSKNSLPIINSSGSCVVSCDFDKDGDQDLFIGGRLELMSYPMPPKSYLLENDGNGSFTDVTAQVATGLDSIGMVTCALFSDYDNDGWQDLILGGEWMPITIFKNVNGVFNKSFEANIGWWSGLAEGDFDNDGDMDYVAGNHGLNSVFKTSENEPVTLYAKDFDKSGTIDPLISYYIQGKEVPFHFKETLLEQIPSLSGIIKTYAQYGQMEMPDLIKILGGDNMYVKKAETFASCYIENKGNGAFAFHQLPAYIQVSPLNGFSVCDLNGDGNLDFLAVGNSFSEETLTGFLDAGIGAYALGNGDGTFEIVPPAKSGFCVRTDAKDIVEIKVAGKRKWVISSNNAPLVMYEENDESSSNINP